MPATDTDVERNKTGRRRAPPAADDRGLPSQVDSADEERAKFLSVGTLRTQYLDYINTKVDEIEEQKDARRYYHGAHWTAEQIRILRARHQPPTTWNRVARKINGIVGLVERMRSDPKAEPTNPQSERGAEIANHAIRYVLDENEWKGIEPWCLLQCGIDGVAGVQLVLTQGDQGDPDIALPWVIGDEYFYDPKSYRLDFADARYQGIAKWLDIDEAIELFPDKEELLRGLMAGDTDITSNPDREYKWVLTNTRQIRLVEHWYKHRGQWCWAFYVANVLLDQGLSPWYDHKNKRMSSFQMFRAAVDQDGDTYGFVRNLKGPQDAFNQGKSKTLHIANSRRLILDKGAVDDVEITRREWARPDGVVEVNPGKKVTPDTTTADLAAFNLFTEDAKNELDAFANLNVAAISGTAVTQLSGRAIELLRQPGMAELGPFVLSIRAWKLKLYRAIWSAVQRYWQGERWIRVTNDKAVAQFIQLNGLGLDPQGRPAIVNALGALNVNIVLEEGRDVGAIMDDVYDALKGYPPGTFPPQVLVEMSNLPRTDKDRIIALMQPKPQPPNPLQQEAVRQQLEGGAIRNAKEAANVRKIHAGAEQALASAEEKRAKIGDMTHENHLDVANFAIDTLREAAELEHKFAQPQPGAMPQGAGAPQAPMPQ